MSWDEATRSLECWREGDDCGKCLRPIKLRQRMTRDLAGGRWNHLYPSDCAWTPRKKLYEPEQQRCFACGSTDHTINLCPELSPEVEYKL